MKGLWTILLLMCSNIFMTLAWYGHLETKKLNQLTKWGLFMAIMVSWGLAFFEYIFQVPANKIGYEENGGPFSMFQLKMIQEIISLSVFTLFVLFIFKSDKLSWNYIAGFVCILLAVFFVFKKW
ncbi:MAG TPA: DMT family protein [Cytophagaceae bacterium]|nr:DMT family protein [Cytophagaceae bacterium]